MPLSESCFDRISACVEKNAVLFLAADTEFAEYLCSFGCGLNSKLKMKRGDKEDHKGSMYNRKHHNGSMYNRNIISRKIDVDCA